MKLYEIYYEVDTGYEYIKNRALVKAERESDALILLRDHINSLSSEHCIHEVFEIKEFFGHLFISDPNLRGKNKL